MDAERGDVDKQLSEPAKRPGLPAADDMCKSDREAWVDDLAAAAERELGSQRSATPDSYWEESRKER